MYGYENNRNSPVYRYTRTAPNMFPKKKGLTVPWGTWTTCATLKVCFRNGLFLCSFDCFFFHKFKFEGGGIRIWRAYAIGQGRLIPYQDFIVKPQGPTGLVVNENFFPLKAARLHKTTTNSDGGKSNGLFAGSEPGCNMVFKKCSELESHLDIGEHCHIRWNFDTAYDRLKRDWVEKFLSVDKEDIDRAHLESTYCESGWPEWILQLLVFQQPTFEEACWALKDKKTISWQKHRFKESFTTKWKKKKNCQID